MKQNVVKENVLVRLGYGLYSNVICLYKAGWEQACLGPARSTIYWADRLERSGF